MKKLDSKLQKITDVDKCIEDVLVTYRKELLLQRRNEILGKIDNNDLTKEEVANLEAQLNEVIIQLAKIKQGGYIVMKKENENEKVQSKVEKTVEHKDKKDVTPEEKLNNIIKKAKEKGKITYGELASELDDANTEQIE